MKKILAILISLIFSVSLVACGDESDLSGIINDALNNGQLSNVAGDDNHNDDNIDGSNTPNTPDNDNNGDTPDNTVCQHVSATKVENKSDAGCTFNGFYVEVEYCTLCSVELSRNTKTIDSLGHDEVNHDAKAPTCEEIGWEAYVTCTRCDYTTYCELGISDHNYIGRFCSGCGIEAITEGLEYTLNADGVSYSLTGVGFSGNENVYIPSTYNGLPVTAIGNKAFANWGDIVRVFIPDSVTSIENNAFYYCNQLESIEIPNSVTNIGDWAFARCWSLKDIVISANVISIGESAFAYCDALESIIIPDGVTSIGESAFSGCISLASITIPDSLKTIDDYAFSGCKSLTNIRIPDGVEEISDNAFADCGALVYNEYENAYYLGNENNPYLILAKAFTNATRCEIHKDTKLVLDNAFVGCTVLKSIETSAENTVYKSIDGNLYSQDEKALLQYAIGKEDVSFDIPDGVTSIGNNAFEGCKSLKSINIPSSVTSIGNYAFKDCTQLESIDIPSNVTRIGNGAFYFCGSLRSIEIPKKVTSIGDRAFYYCYNLQNIVITDTVKSVGDWAFGFCQSLASITLPNSVTSIGDEAFAFCESLDTFVIPASVTEMGIDIFHGCTSLINIEVAKENTVYSSINGNLYSKDGKTLLRYAIGKTDSSFTIPDGVTGIGDYAFNDCGNLVSVVIPNAVTSMGNFVFTGCTSLTIYCEAESKPDGWSNDWNGEDYPVVWDCNNL